MSGAVGTNLLRFLVELNLTGEQMLNAIEAIEADTLHVVPPHDSTAEKRRAYDRDRKAAIRAGKSGGSPVEVRADAPLNGPPSPHTPHPPLNPPSSLRSLTPREQLLAVLDETRADAVIDHRKRKRAPLTGHAAKLLAAKFGSCPDPNAAADAMIANGWQGFEPEWLARQTDSKITPFNRGGPSGVREATDILRETAARLRAGGSLSPGDGADSGHARLLPGPR